MECHLAFFSSSGNEVYYFEKLGCYAMDLFFMERYNSAMGQVGTDRP